MISTYNKDKFDRNCNLLQYMAKSGIINSVYNKCINYNINFRPH